MDANILGFILSVIAGVVSGWLMGISKFVFDNKHNIFMAIHSKFLWNKEIRFSISYLFTIKVDSKYLLIKGSRIEQYQPVGGVFKMLPSFKEGKRSFELTSDEGLPIDENSKDDLRVRVKGKHLLKFVNWFHSRKNREVGVHREFYEELVKTGILHADSLKSFNPEYCKTVTAGIRYSVHLKCQEVLIYEIYEVELSSSEEAKIKDYVNKNRYKAIFATKAEIEKECIDVDGVSKKIGAHANHII